jgi:hypothetical protein
VEPSEFQLDPFVEICLPCLSTFIPIVGWIVWCIYRGKDLFTARFCAIAGTFMTLVGDVAPTLFATWLRRNMIIDKSNFLTLCLVSGGSIILSFEFVRI